MIQTFTKADVARIAHLQPDGWEDITPFFQFYTETSFCHALKIEDNNQIVAVGSLILLKSTAWFAHIIVAPAMHRKGLGSELTEQLITYAESKGCNKQLLIATAMGMPMYEYFGFQRSCEYFYYEKHTRGAAVESAYIRALNQSDKSELLALDKSATGEDRSALILPGHNPGWVYTRPNGEGIRGYFLPKLGEGTIVAKDTEAGTALMKLRLSALEAGAVFPAGNHAARGFLTELGVSLKRSATRMVRQGADPLNQEMLFNRIGGHIG